MPAEHLPTVMTLDALLDGFASAPSLPVNDIALDSRRLRPGSLFLACAGTGRHGLNFHSQAVAAGAVAIAYDASTAEVVPADSELPLVPVDDLAAHVGKIADRFFASPSLDLQVVGVTGTNGKTTVAWLLAQCLAGLKRRCGYSGTLGFGIERFDRDDDMTSPDVVEMHRRLARFRNDGADYAAIEVSSHALDQRRVDNVVFDAALFTNLSRDHLDYHGSMRAYGEAKAKLFTRHAVERRIINLDSDFGTELAARCGDDVVTVSTKFDRVANGRPFVFVRTVIARPGGSDIRVQSSWGETRLFVPLPGEFNVANAVLVLAYLLSIGIELDAAAAALAGVTAPPGRMQRVGTQEGPAVYVDYAHTPTALDVALRALRSHCRGRLWVVFGCGGERDPGKRPQMGRVAERLAQRVVVTNDNPRAEAPGAIVDMIVSGMIDPSNGVVIEDRGAAIGWAIANAADDDTILIAGKGHENYQLVADQRLEFSDYAVAAVNLEARLGTGRS